MHNQLQSTFFHHIDDYVTHLRWLFIISEGKPILLEDIVKLSEALSKQIEQAEACTEDVKKAFIQSCISKFSKYEQEVVDKQSLFLLSDYLNPKGRLLSEIRDSISRYQSNIDKEKCLTSLIIQMKDASNLLFKIGKSNFRIFRGEGNTVVEAEMNMTTATNGIMLIKSENIHSVTKDAMCFLYQVFEAFSAILDAVSLENIIDIGILQVRSGVTLCNRDKDRITRIIGSTEQVNYYLNEMGLSDKQNGNDTQVFDISNHIVLISKIYDEFKDDLNVKFDEFTTAISRADFAAIAPKKKVVLLYVIYTVGNSMGSIWYNKAAQSRGKSKQQCSGAGITESYKKRFAEIMKEG